MANPKRTETKTAPKTDGFQFSNIEPIATTATTLIGASVGAAGGLGVAALGRVGLAAASATTAVVAGTAVYLLSATMDDKKTALGTGVASAFMAGLATASAGGLSGLTPFPLLSGAVLGAGGGLCVGAYATGS